MKQNRKDQLNRKLQQIFENGSGRTEGIIENLLLEQMYGHEYTVQQIGATQEHLSDWTQDKTDKTFTLVEFGLYQVCEGQIANFLIPVSEIVLQQFASRIDAAYYQWMQREPQILRGILSRQYDYYRELMECTLGIEPISKEGFEALSIDGRYDTMCEAEWYAFLPHRNVGEKMIDE